MLVLDPGHRYRLNTLDGFAEVVLQFVKREGKLYPGNVGTAPGTTTQEVLRACIDRLEYVNRQLPCAETEAAIGLLTSALFLLESRAARRHGRDLEATLAEIVEGKRVCKVCGHIGCLRDCR
jgi:hypothetical protein